MKARIELLNWDSELFGYKVGELKSDNLSLPTDLELASKENYKLLYFRVNSEDNILNEACLKFKGLLVDEKITFLRNVPKLYDFVSKTKLYETGILNNDLTNLGLQSGVFSRFKLDSNFKNNEFEKLYKIWINNSINKQICEKVIIQKESNDIFIGLLTLGIKNHRADIGLLAVDEKFRGNNIGLNLIMRSFYESNGLNINQIQVVTQKANIPACAFYNKMGFKIELIENIYHFWL